MKDLDYIPFGPEWEKVLMKLPKKFIINQYRKACQADPAKDQMKLTMLINFVNCEMANTVEWTGEYWQWKK